MLRYFIDPNGKAYKATKPRSPEDMERLNPSQEQLDALPDDGSGITEIQRNAIMNGIVPGELITEKEVENEIIL